MHLEKTGLADRTVTVINAGDAVTRALPGGESFPQFYIAGMQHEPDGAALSTLSAPL